MRKSVILVVLSVFLMAGAAAQTDANTQSIYTLTGAEEDIESLAYDITSQDRLVVGATELPTQSAQQDDVFLWKNGQVDYSFRVPLNQGADDVAISDRANFWGFTSRDGVVEIVEKTKGGNSQYDQYRYGDSNGDVTEIELGRTNVYIGQERSGSDRVHYVGNPQICEEFYGTGSYEDSAIDRSEFVIRAIELMETREYDLDACGAALDVSGDLDGVEVAPNFGDRPNSDIVYYGEVDQGITDVYRMNYEAPGGTAADSPFTKIYSDGLVGWDVSEDYFVAHTGTNFVVKSTSTDANASSRSITYPNDVSAVEDFQVKGDKLWITSEEKVAFRDTTQGAEWRTVRTGVGGTQAIAAETQSVAYSLGTVALVEDLTGADDEQSFIGKSYEVIENYFGVSRSASNFFLSLILIVSVTGIVSMVHPLPGIFAGASTTAALAWTSVLPSSVAYILVLIAAGILAWLTTGSLSGGD